MWWIDSVGDASVLQAPAAANTDGHKFFQDTLPTGTRVTADWANMVQEELLNVVLAAQLQPSKTTYTQLLQAIWQFGGPGRFVIDEGALNALAVTLLPAPQANAYCWMLVYVANTTTGAATINVNGLGAVQITYQGEPLQPGALAAGQIYLLAYDGQGTAQYQLLSPPAVTTAPATPEETFGSSGAFALPAPSSAPGTIGSWRWDESPEGIITQEIYVQLVDYGSSGDSPLYVAWPKQFPTACFGPDLTNYSLMAGQGGDSRLGLAAVANFTTQGCSLIMHNTQQGGTRCVFKITARGN